MTKINSYLTFNGNCREAMNFYRECLGGELSLQTIGDSPLSDKMPPKMKNAILHATLNRDGFMLMASDMVADEGLKIGNSVSMMLDCSSADELHAVYKKLSEGGKKDHPVEVSFWGALFGDLTDKFGNRWLLHYQQ